MQLPNLLETLCVLDIKSDDRKTDTASTLLVRFMHLVEFRNETSNCISSLMESVLQLQF
jgi:hypothetical protein